MNFERPGYRYLPDLSWADSAFEAQGNSLEQLFQTSVDALLSVMFHDPESIKGSAVRLFMFEVREDRMETALEKMLHQVLEEVVFLKDSEQLLMRLRTVQVKGDQENGWKVSARFEGCPIPTDPEVLGTDVKAVTWHRFHVEPARSEGSSWTATVLLDV